MFVLPGVKVYISTLATDMRKSFDGLATLVKSQMGKDAFNLTFRCSNPYFYI